MQRRDPPRRRSYPQTGSKSTTLPGPGKHAGVDGHLFPLMSTAGLRDEKIALFGSLEKFRGKLSI